MKKLTKIFTLLGVVALMALLGGLLTACNLFDNKKHACVFGEWQFAAWSIPDGAEWDNAWAVTTPATCDEDGVETRTRTRESYRVCTCGEEYTGTTTAPIDQLTQTETRTVKASCVFGEWEYGTWSILDEVWDADGGWTITKESTCTTDGSRTRSRYRIFTRDCATCGEVDEYINKVTELEVIDALGHNHQWTVVTAPLETTDGLEKYKCEHCGDVADTRTAHATGTAGLAFTRILIGGVDGYSVSRGTADTVGFIWIPDYHNGFSVIRVAPNAFYNTAIASVRLGANIKRIDVSAFSGTKSLVSIEIPASVALIEVEAFYHSALQTVIFAENSALYAIGNKAFAYTAITSIILPNSLRKLSGTSFDYVTTLSSILIHADITLILYSDIAAFRGWTSGQTIYIAGHADYRSTYDAWKPYWRKGLQATVLFAGQF